MAAFVDGSVHGFGDGLVLRPALFACEAIVANCLVLNVHDLLVGPLERLSYFLITVAQPKMS